MSIIFVFVLASINENILFVVLTKISLILILYFTNYNYRIYPNMSPSLISVDVFVQFSHFWVKNREKIFINETIKKTCWPQDASFKPLTLTLGPTGRPVARRMKPKKEKIDA